MKIIHLSDIHIGKHIGFPSDVLLKTKSPVVITGDLSDNGSLQQLNIAKQYIDNLKQNGIPVLICPGNHDYSITGGNNFNRHSLMNFHKVFGIDYYPTFNVINGVYFIGLNTIEGKLLKKDYYGIDGEIGDKQLKRLDNIITEIRRERSQPFRIVLYMHHTISDRNPFKILLDRDKLFKIINNRIDILLCGHSHVLARHKALEKKLGIKVISEAPSTNNFESIENHIIFNKKMIKELKNFYIIPEIIINDDKIEYRVKKYKK